MSKVRTVNVNQIPEELLNDKELNLQIKQLPENYNFEIHKTIWRIKTIQAKRGRSTNDCLDCFIDHFFDQWRCKCPKVYLHLPVQLLIYFDRKKCRRKNYTTRLLLVIRMSTLSLWVMLPMEPVVLMIMVLEH